MPRCLLLPRCIASLALLSTWSRSGVSIGKIEKPIEAVRRDRLVLDLEGLREHAGDAPGKGLCVLRVVARRLQSQKFVAALARQKLAGTQHPPHPVGDLDQQQVAGAMAEQIVDVLEAVEVDRERGELVRLLMGLGGVERQPFVEGDAVRQAGHACR